MAYKDPYAEQYGRYDHQPVDSPGLNAYDNAPPHQAYDRGGYDSYGARGHSEDARGSPPGHHKFESTRYDHGAFARATTGNRRRDLRHWRYEHHGALWTRGGRGACFGRFCCCTLMSAVFLIISILLPLALWARPPNVIVGSVQPNTSNGSEIQTLSNGVQINLEVPIYVSNPNYFSVSFSSIKANIYYPINNTLIGGGQQNGVTFHSHTNTNFTFPFSIQYTTAMSSSVEIIADLISKCGLAGGTASDITVNYDITLGLRVLLFTVSPTISNSASFLCPLTASDIPSLSGTGLV